MENNEKMVLDIKKFLYPLTNMILKTDVKLPMEVYYNLIKTEENSEGFNPDDFRLKNEVKDIKEPIIIAVNHSNVHDWPTVNRAIKTHSIVLSAVGNLQGFDGVVINLNGCVPVDRTDKKSRQESFKRMEEVIKSGHNVMMFVEGVWNLKESLPMLPFSWGIIDLSQKTGAKIMPVILEYNDDKILVNVGSLIDTSKFNNKVEEYHRLRDTMATLRWNLWEVNKPIKHGEYTKNDFLENKQKLMSAYTVLDYDEEDRLIFHDHDTFDEVWEPIRKLHK